MYTIDKAKSAIRDGIRGYLLKDEHGQYIMKEVNRLPFYLEGSPGIGKTEIVHQIAQELGIGYVSFSLVHHTRNSLLGLPVIKELENGDKYTCYTMSEIIAKVSEQLEAGHKEGILLLDEFPCMSETILPAMLSFLQTKNIGTHRLPEGWVIVLCGNPPEYNKTARTFDAAIMDRIRKLQVEFQSDTFLEYAEEIRIHPAIVDYLKVHRNNIYRYRNEKKIQELVTCRGWENVSHMLKTYEILNQNVDRDAIRQYIKSEEIAGEFYQFYEKYSLEFTSKCAEDILKGVRRDHYVKKYQELPYEQKWKLVSYTFDYLNEKLTKYNQGWELYTEAEQIMAQLEHLCLEAEESDDEDFDPGYWNIDTMSDAISFLVSYENLATSSVVNRNAIEKWKEFAQVNSEEESFVFLGDVYRRCLESLKEWKSTIKCEFSGDEMKKASEMLARLLTFTDQIDQEKALLEMIFRKINSSELLLMALDEHPNEIYRNLCAKRYAL